MAKIICDVCGKRGSKYQMTPSTPVGSRKTFWVCSFKCRYTLKIAKKIKETNK